MKLIFLGEPGSGKGTIAKIISEKLNIPHISTGEIFRREIEEDTELGKKIKSMPLYAFVSDDITIAIIKKRLSKDDCKNGFILDGFPRNIEQADALKEMTAVDYVIKFYADEDFIIKRLLSRRKCPGCGKNYNLITSMKPKNDNEMCDICNVKLEKRVDDNEETIKERLKLYEKETEPLMEYYKHNLKEIENIKPPEEVAEDTLNEIRNLS